MEPSDDHLTANLRRAYTSYKTSGISPIIVSPIQVDDTTFQTTKVSNNLPASAKERSAFPEIVRVQSSYNIPTEERAPRTSKPYASQEIPNQNDGAGIMYEYEVDDAAGIPSLGFFNKPYSLPVNRQGSMGGSWRHVRQCTGQGGSNLLFIDGAIKDKDCQNYPPFGIMKSNMLTNQLGQRLVPKKSTLYNKKAKEGFQYWYKEPKANIRGEFGVGGITLIYNQHTSDDGDQLHTSRTTSAANKIDKWSSIQDTWKIDESISNRDSPTNFD